MIVWMSSYRKRTTSQIEKLLLRIEEQDEKIQRLEQQFLQSQQQQRLSQLATSFLPVATPAPAAAARPKPAQSAAPLPKKTPLPNKSSPEIVVPSSPPVVEVIEPEPVAAETEQDLDELLQAELAELIAPAPVVTEDIEEISTEHLKKKSPQ
jgi:uncharacterized membrane protein